MCIFFQDSTRRWPTFFFSYPFFDGSKLIGLLQCAFFFDFDSRQNGRIAHFIDSRSFFNLQSWHFERTPEIPCLVYQKKVTLNPHQLRKLENPKHCWHPGYLCAAMVNDAQRAIVGGSYWHTVCMLALGRYMDHWKQSTSCFGGLYSWWTSIMFSGDYEIIQWDFQGHTQKARGSDWKSKTYPFWDRLTWLRAFELRECRLIHLGLLTPFQ